MKFNFDRIADPATQSRRARDLLGPYEGADVIDTHTVRLRFTAPTPGLPYILTLYFFGMVSPTAAARPGENLTKRMIGTGPLIFVQEVPRTRVALRRNRAYAWAPGFFGQQGPTRYGRLVIRLIEEDETRLLALERGEAQVIDEIAPTAVPRLRADQRFSVFAVPRLGFPRGLHINSQLPPTDDVRVREAIVRAISSEDLVQTVLRGVYPASYQALARGTKYYDATTERSYRYDPNRSRQLLEEAGWRAGPDGIRVRDGRRLRVAIATGTGFVFEAPVEYAQAKLREIGVEADIRVIAGAAYIPSLVKADSEFNMGLIGSFDVDPTSLFFRFYHSRNYGASNYAHIRNPEIDGVLERSRTTLNEGEKQRLLGQIPRFIGEQALVAPLYTNASVFASRADLGGMRFDPRGNPLFYGVTR